MLECLRKFADGRVSISLRAEHFRFSKRAKAATLGDAVGTNPKNETGRAYRFNDEKRRQHEIVQSFYWRVVSRAFRPLAPERFLE
jgi:hypothetical protein